MNKTELVNALALRTGLSKKSAEDVLTTALDIITETLVQGEKVQLVGFGSFEVRERAPRIGRNPRTREEVTIPASRAVQFKSGKVLKSAVSQSEPQCSPS